MPKVVKYHNKCYELSRAGYILPELEVPFDKGAEDYTGRLDWQTLKLDDTMGLEYPLTKDSVVIEVGGYLGDWAGKVWDLYKCNIWVLEPVDEYYKKCYDRYSGNIKIRVLNKGLGEETETVPMEVDGDKSRAGKGNLVYMLDAGEWIKQFKEIDLIQINCEGGEYEIFKRLFETKLINRIKNIKVQFHNNDLGNDILRKDIQRKLKKTHRLSYCYDWVWESWERK